MHWQRLHPSSAAEAYERTVDHSPTAGIDFDCPPKLVAKVEIEASVQATYAKMDNTLRPIEMGPGFDHVQRRLQRF
jgi:hypothetical protein